MRQRSITCGQRGAKRQPASSWPTSTGSAAPTTVTLRSRPLPLCCAGSGAEATLIILAGEVARIAGKPLRLALETHLMSELHWRGPTLRSSSLGDDAVFLGALDQARSALSDQIFANA